jgi:hypothetical protein
MNITRYNTCSSNKCTKACPGEQVSMEIMYKVWKKQVCKQAVASSNTAGNNMHLGHGCWESMLVTRKSIGVSLLHKWDQFLQKQSKLAQAGSTKIKSSGSGARIIAVETRKWVNAHNRNIMVTVNA